MTNKENILVEQKFQVKNGMVRMTEFKDGSVEFEFETDKKVIMNIMDDKVIKFTPVD